MAAIAGARRTQSAYPRFFASTNPSDISVVDATGLQAGNGQDDGFVSTLRSLPHVRSVASWAALNSLPVDSSGAPQQGAGNNSVFLVGSDDGRFSSQDTLTVVSGRLPDPTRDDEIVMTSDAARLLGGRVGASAPQGFYTDTQASSADYGTAAVKPALVIELRVVGIVVENDAVVQDDTDRLPTFVIAGPGVVKRLESKVGALHPVYAGLRLDDPSNVAVVEQEIASAAPGDAVVSVASARVAKVERAIAPDSLVLVALGGIAMVASLLIAGQMVRRLLHRRAAELRVIGSLGGTRMMAIADLGLLATIVSAALVAVATAVALSPLAPIGPMRDVVHHHGLAIDWAVTLPCVLALMVVPLLVLVLVAPRLAMARPSRRARRHRVSRLAAAAAASGCSPALTTGVRFAVEPADQSNSSPVRAVMLAVVVAVGMVATISVVGTSLNALVSHPSLYGWNWDVVVRSGYGGISNIPSAKADAALSSDASVVAWSGAYFATVDLDGIAVPVVGLDPGAVPGPSMLSGHQPTDATQIVLGATTLATLHKRIGDEVTLSSSSTSTRLRIVGTAALPAVGLATALHLDLSVGAVVATSLIPADQRGLGDHDGPEAYLVRLRVPTPSAEAALAKDAAQLTTDGDGTATLLDVQRPAEINSFRAIGALPTVIALVLSVGAAAALGLTLVASVRRRRRDLAVLRTLGFTTRQLISVLVWESIVVVAVGTAVGVPIGVIVGRTVWDRFAGAIHVVSRADVSVLALVALTGAAVVVAVVAALVSAPRVARSETAVLLRAE